MEFGQQSELELLPSKAETMHKVQPLLSDALRFRFPLDCGGNLQHLRFQGAAAPSLPTPWKYFTFHAETWGPPLRPIHPSKSSKTIEAENVLEVFAVICVMCVI